MLADRTSLVDVQALRDPMRCPACAVRLTVDEPRCASCDMPLRGALVGQLWQLSLHAAATLDQRQGVIAALRAEDASAPAAAVDDARPADICRDDSRFEDAGTGARVWAPPSPPAATTPSSELTRQRSSAPCEFAEEPDEGVTGPGIKVVLLSLGVLLVVIASAIFAVASWGRLGIGGRTAILAGVTLAAGAGTVLAARRELRGTAESMSLITAALLLLDAHGIHNYDLAGSAAVPADVWWSGVLIAGAVLGATANRRLPLSAPAVATAGAVQLPLLILHDRFSAGWCCAALLVQATVATVVASWVWAAARPTGDRQVQAECPIAVDRSLRSPVRGARTSRPVGFRRSAAPGEVDPTSSEGRSATGNGSADLGWDLLLGGGLTAWLVGAGIAAGLAYQADPAEPLVPVARAGLLLLTALTAAGLSLSLRRWKGLVELGTAIAVGAAVAAAHAPAYLAWSADSSTLLGAGLLAVGAAALVLLPALPARPAMGAAAAVAVGGLVAATQLVRPLAHRVGDSLRWLEDPWSVATTGLARSTEHHERPEVVLIAFVLSLTGALLTFRLPEALKSAAVAATFSTALAGLLVFPGAAGVGYTPTMIGFTTVGAALLACAARMRPELPPAADEAPGRHCGSGAQRKWDARTIAGFLAAGAVLLALGLGQSLALRWATLTAAGITLLATGFARCVARPSARPTAAACAVIALVAEVGVAVAVAHGGGGPAETAALATAGLCVVLARWLPTPRERAAVEATATTSAVVLLSAATEAGWSWQALLVAGVAAALVALDPARRQVGWVAGACLTASSWARLTEAHIHTPEAYTTGPALALLMAGWWARRAGPDDRRRLSAGPRADEQPTLTSWCAYGAGLSTGLLPSLLATLTDGTLARPLLLGAGALAALLAGVARRLAAPLAMGAAVLAADALVQLGPYAHELPRWVGIGAAGVLLLGLGATWEQRLADLRRTAERFAELD